MFQATHRPPSGAQKLYLQPLVLYAFLVAGRCDGSAIATAGNQKLYGRKDRKGKDEVEDVQAAAGWQRK